jgi:hypothetical protein
MQVSAGERESDVWQAAPDLQPNMMPTASGRLACTSEPDNLHYACAGICDEVEDRARLAQARWDFKSVPSSTTIDALLVGLGHPLPGLSDTETTTQLIRHVTIKSIVPDDANLGKESDG